jgi:hypothetical protein
MVVGVRFRDGRLHMRMRVSTDRHRFIDIERVQRIVRRKIMPS